MTVVLNQRNLLTVQSLSKCPPGLLCRRKCLQRFCNATTVQLCQQIPTSSLRESPVHIRTAIKSRAITWTGRPADSLTAVEAPWTYWSRQYVPLDDVFYSDQNKVRKRWYCVTLVWASWVHYWASHLVLIVAVLTYFFITEIYSHTTLLYMIRQPVCGWHLSYHFRPCCS